MKRTAAIFLMSLYLISTTECYQLLKLPAFIVHFIRHSNEDPNTTLSSFIKMHYAEEMVYDDDWQQDMQLPFKTHEDLLSVIPATCPPPAFVVMAPVETPIEPCMIIHDTRLKPSIYQPKIFQPPRA